MANDSTLLPYWTTKLDNKGRLYYVDHYGRTTTRDDPRLPEGWDFGLTATGQPYFQDNNTNTTTWIDPRPPKSSDADIPTYDGRTPNVT